MGGEELTRFVKEQAGEYLRGVVAYNAQSFDVIYVRDDLRSEEFLQRVRTIHDHLTQPSPSDPVNGSWGETHATLNIRDDAVILNLCASDTDGFLVGLEPEAARQLSGFVNECLHHGLAEWETA